MRDEGAGLSRRGALGGAFGAAGAVMALGFASGRSEAAEMGALEKANAKVVNAFLKDWSKGDSAKLGAYLAEDCVVRMEENKPLMGRAAAVAGIQSYFDRDWKFSMAVLETFAKGPVVVNSRKDTVTMGEKKPVFAVAGVFLVRDGKIHEWSDFVVQG
jgi:limonene-1,2-epoxide hydrolase